MFLQIIESIYTQTHTQSIYKFTKPQNANIKEGSQLFINLFSLKIKVFGSHEIKRCLLLGRKAMTNLDSILKSWDITLPTKVHIVKVMVFPVVMYNCASWTTKKAERWKIDAFELWCWRRLLRVPWTARRSKQSILKEINPEYSLQRLMLKLKFQHFGHLIWRADSLEKTLILGKTEGRRKRGRQLDGITDSMDIEFEQALGDSEGQGCGSSWGHKELDTTYRLNNKENHCLTGSGTPRYWKERNSNYRYYR